MDNPRKEIVNVVKSWTLAPTPAAQKAAIERYFDPQAGFQHTLCNVQPGPGSRENIVGIYQWYRDMSPKIDSEVESFVYDERENVAYLDVVQTFHIFLSPFKPSPARLLVKVNVRQNASNGKYYIVQQSDYYQPEDLFNLTVPVLAPLVVYTKRATAYACVWNNFAYSYFRSFVQKGVAFFHQSLNQAQGPNGLKVRSD